MQTARARAALRGDLLAVRALSQRTPSLASERRGGSDEAPPCREPACHARHRRRILIVAHPHASLSGGTADHPREAACRRSWIREAAPAADHRRSLRLHRSRRLRPHRHRRSHHRQPPPPPPKPPPPPPPPPPNPPSTSADPSTKPPPIPAAETATATIAGRATVSGILKRLLPIQRRTGTGICALPSAAALLLPAAAAVPVHVAVVGGVAGALTGALVLVTLAAAAGGQIRRVHPPCRCCRGHLLAARSGCFSRRTVRVVAGLAVVASARCFSAAHSGVGVVSLACGTGLRSPGRSVVVAAALHRALLAGALVDVGAAAAHADSAGTCIGSPACPSTRRYPSVRTRHGCPTVVAGHSRPVPSNTDAVQAQHRSRNRMRSPPPANSTARPLRRRSWVARRTRLFPPRGCSSSPCRTRPRRRARSPCRSNPACSRHRHTAAKRRRRART